MYVSGSAVKNLPAVQETQERWVRSLGWEDPLEEGTATHPVFLPGESQGQRSLVGYSPRGRTESETTEVTDTHTHTHTHTQSSRGSV